MPSLDLQVAAGADDTWEKQGDGSNYPVESVIYMDASASGPTYIHWGGYRWASGSLPVLGSTITVCYFQPYIYMTAADDIRVDLHFQLATAPAQFTAGGYDLSSRTRTGVSVLWAADSLGTGYKTSPELKTVLQEVINSYSPTALVLVAKARSDDTKSCVAWAKDGSANSAKLHIEWNSPGGTAGKSAAMGAKLIAGKMI
jgi:hypothetical protein